MHFQNKGTCMAGCLRGEGGRTQSPTALQTGPTAVGQREHVALSFTHSFGDQLWSECGERQAQWCCCYKYASTSVSKWQLYSGPRTQCLGTVRASHSKKGKPSVRALVDMYLCTCSNWYVVYKVQTEALDCDWELKCYFKCGCNLTIWQ